MMERLTTRLILYCEIGDSIRVYSMYGLTRELTVILVIIWWLQNLQKYWQ